MAHTSRRSSRDVAQHTVTKVAVLNTSLCSASYVAADNVSLLSFAAERRAAVRRAARCPTAATVIDISCPPAGPTAANPPQRRVAAE